MDNLALLVSLGRLAIHLEAADLRYRACMLEQTCKGNNAHRAVRAITDAGGRLITAFSVEVVKPA